MKQFYTKLDDEQIRMKSFHLRIALNAVDSLLPNLFVLEETDISESVNMVDCNNSNGIKVRFIYSLDGIKYRESWSIFLANRNLDISSIKLGYDTESLYDMADWKSNDCQETICKISEEWESIREEKNDEPLLCVQDYPSCIVYDED